MLWSKLLWDIILVLAICSSVALICCIYVHLYKNSFEDLLRHDHVICTFWMHTCVFRVHSLDEETIELRWVFQANKVFQYSRSTGLIVFQFSFITAVLKKKCWFSVVGKRINIKKQQPWEHKNNGFKLCSLLINRWIIEIVRLISYYRIVRWEASGANDCWQAKTLSRRYGTFAWWQSKRSLTMTLYCVIWPNKNCRRQRAVLSFSITKWWSWSEYSF